MAQSPPRILRISSERFQIQEPHRLVGRTKAIIFTKEGKCWLPISRSLRARDNRPTIRRKWFKKGRISYLYHYTFWLFTGVKPKQLNHSCNNPWCINPGHVYEGDQSDNIEDAYQAGNRNA